MSPKVQERISDLDTASLISWSSLHVCSLLCVPLHSCTIQYMIHTLLLTILLLSPQTSLQSAKGLLRSFDLFFFFKYIFKENSQRCRRTFSRSCEGGFAHHTTKIIHHSYTLFPPFSIESIVIQSPTHGVRTENSERIQQKELPPPLCSYRQICSIWNRHFFMVFSTVWFKELFALITRMKILSSI